MRIFDRKSIRRLRKSLGLTCREFGDRLGVTRQAIQNWETETSQTKPTVKTLEKIMAEFGVDESFFFADDCNCDHSNGHHEAVA